MTQGTCQTCGKHAWINSLTTLWHHPGMPSIRGTKQCCAECFDKFGPRKRPSTGKSATKDDAPPSWDNVVRASEEDR